MLFNPTNHPHLRAALEALDNINKNIERQREQNDEIIRLLKKIADRRERGCD